MEETKTMAQLLDEYFDAVVTLENLDETEKGYAAALAKYNEVTAEYIERIKRNKAAAEAEKQTEPQEEASVGLTF